MLVGVCVLGLLGAGVFVRGTLGGVGGGANGTLNCGVFVGTSSVLESANGLWNVIRKVGGTST